MKIYKGQNVEDISREDAIQIAEEVTGLVAHTDRDARFLLFLAAEQYEVDAAVRHIFGQTDKLAPKPSDAWAATLISVEHSK